MAAATSSSQKILDQIDAMVTKLSTVASEIVEGEPTDDKIKRAAETARLVGRMVELRSNTAECYNRLRQGERKFEFAEFKGEIETKLQVLARQVEQFRGGTAEVAKLYLDLSDQVKEVQALIAISPITSPGLNLLGICPAPEIECTFSGKTVSMAHGFGEFNVGRVSCESHCPECGNKVVDVSQVVLSECSFSLEGRNSKREVERYSRQLSPGIQIKLCINGWKYLMVVVSELS